MDTTKKNKQIIIIIPDHGSNNCTTTKIAHTRLLKTVKLLVSYSYVSYHEQQQPSKIVKEMSPRGSSIGCGLRLIKQRSQVRIPSPPSLVWTCQKKKKKHCKRNICAVSHQALRTSFSKLFWEPLNLVCMRDVKVKRNEGFK